MNLATWWIQASEGVNYYRARMPAKHLPGQVAELGYASLKPGEVEGSPEFIQQHGDTAIWMFPGNITRWVLMAELHDQGHRVMVEVDDNYTTNPPLAHLSQWQIKRDRTGKDNHNYETHKAICRSEAVSGVIVSTPYLGRVYEKFGKPVYVCPNSVDPDDWDYVPEHQPNGVLRVGFAGSVSHAYDIADIYPALDWAWRQDGVEVVMMGQIDPGIPFTSVPWTDTLADYRRNVQMIDVMLCPLRPSFWANAKSDVKALEGAMGGAVPVVSRTEPFRPWWDTDAPCLVADSKKGFVKAVKHLIKHRDEARDMARAAREWALKNRSIHNSIENWREAVSG